MAKCDNFDDPKCFEGCPHKTEHEHHKKGCECGSCGSIPCNKEDYCADTETHVKCV